MILLNGIDNAKQPTDGDRDLQAYRTAANRYAERIVANGGKADAILVDVDAVIAGRLQALLDELITEAREKAAEEVGQ